MTLVDDAQLKKLIVERLALGELPVPARERVIYQLGENILTKINLMVLEQLTESERVELLELANRGDSAEVLTYVRKKIGDLNQLIKDAAAFVVTDFQKRRAR